MVQLIQQSTPTCYEETSPISINKDLVAADAVVAVVNGHFIIVAAVVLALSSPVFPLICSHFENWQG